MLINTIGGLWTGFGSAGPRSLYLNGEVGAFFDFSTPTGLATDAAGAVPLTVPGQTIGLAADKSCARSPVTSFAGVQASAGLRPTYGRAPKSRRNRFTATETFNSGTNMTATIVADGTSLVVASGITNAFSARTYTVAEFGKSVVVSLYARPNGARYVHVGRAGGGVWFDLVAGTVLFASAGFTGSISAIGPDGFRRLVAALNNETIADGLNSNARIYPSVNVPTSADPNSGGGNDGVAGVVVNKAQMEQSATATPYQKVLTAFNTTEVGAASYGYARFDGADDKLTTTLPAPIIGDLMLFGRSASLCMSGFSLPSGAFDLGPTGTVVSEGILALLGDLVGVVIIGRTTTATEQALALRYFSARGAGGWLVAGANLWTGGGFNLDTGTAWTINGDGSYTSAGGTGSLGYSSVGSAVVVGRAYLAEMEVVVAGGGTTRLPYDGAGANSKVISTVGIHRTVFVADDAYGPMIYAAAFTGTVRAVSLKPLTLGA